MKKSLMLILCAGALLTSVSCKKCVECTTVDTISYQADDPEDQDFYDDLYSETSITVEKCERKKDIEDYEERNTYTSTTQDSFATATYTTTTTCE